MDMAEETENGIIKRLIKTDRGRNERIQEAKERGKEHKLQSGRLLNEQAH